MAMNKDKGTRGYELYLKCILLLESVAPLVLKGVIDREASKRRGAGSDISIDSLDTSELCDVLLENFASELSTRDLERINYIRDQTEDLHCASSKSLRFNEYERKWDPLCQTLLELIEEIDDSTRYKCTQMMFTFDADIVVNAELIEKMTQAENIGAHIELANKMFPTAVESTRGNIEQNDSPVQFIQTLSNTYVNVGEAVVLVCKLSRAAKPVWIKDNKLLTESETVKFLIDSTSCWLVISSVTVDGAGKYSCLCGSAKTSAFLTVTEQNLRVTKSLHVEKEDVMEHMEISLICTVNMPGQTPTWLHNNQKVLEDSRVCVTSEGEQHKLIIQNFEMEDEGEYVIVFGRTTSKTYIVVKGKHDILHKRQLTDVRYRNWVRGALGLKYLKEGLESLSNLLVERQHKELLEKAQAATGNKVKQCQDCNNENLKPHRKDQCKAEKKHKCLCAKADRRICPNDGFCGIMYDHVISDHLFGELTLENTQIRKWSTDPWSVATAYIKTKGYEGRSSAKEIDCSGLLSLFICNNNCSKYVEIEDTEKARDVRNELLHNSNYELTEDKLKDYIDAFKKVLTMKGSSDVTMPREEIGDKVEDALQLLEKLKTDQIEINTSKEIEQMRNHAMTDEADIYKRSMEETEIKIKQMEENLNQAKMEIQLVFELQTLSDDMKTSTEQEDPLVLDLRLQVHKFSKDRTADSAAKHCLYLILKEEKKNYFDTSVKPTGTSDGQNRQSEPSDEQIRQYVRRILGYICVIKNTKICDVTENQFSIDMRIKCVSCKAVEKLLVMINRQEIKEELVQLRNSLNIYGKWQTNSIDISCTPKSLEDIRKHLDQLRVFRNGNHGATCTKHPEMQNEWYCPKDGIFFCKLCKEEAHRSCIGIISFEDNRVKRKLLAERHHMAKCNVRFDNDEIVTDIHGICVMPDRNIILLDNANRRLKKLNSAYTLVSHCDLPYSGVCSTEDNLHDVCYIGNERVAASVSNSRILFVNASDDMELECEVNLDHECYGLARHCDLLYVTDGKAVYAYSTNGEYKRTVYKPSRAHFPFKSIAVSSDGEKIYIAAADEGLVTVDKKGHHVYTLKNDMLPPVESVCVFGDDTLLIGNESTSNSVLQIASGGDRILGTVITNLADYGYLQSLCYNRNDSGLIIGLRCKDYIIVYS